MKLETSRKTLHKKAIRLQPYVVTMFVILISLTLFRCANMQRPTGGPKDSLPPVILNESPSNFQTNFKNKEIILTFDEYIKLNNQFKEFSISPDVAKQPEYKIKKKNLHILLPDSLEENTTYTINFGKGLVDYNEGNPLLNYNYVFATGDQLDSLIISGSVENALTNSFDFEKDKDVRVLLIPTRQDSIFGKKKANIFTSVDSSGNFIFRNLKEDTYRIYAIKEQNNDRIYNNSDESIGFLQDSIVLSKNLDGLKIAYSKGYPQVFRTLEKKIEKNGKVLLTFNQPIESPVINILFPENYTAEKNIRYSHLNDTASLFLKNLDFDSIKFEIKDGLIVKDTVLLRRSKNEKYEQIVEPKLNITNKVNKISHITLTSDFPISEISKDMILLTEDSISRRNFQLQRDTIDNNLYHIRYNWRAKKNYELTIQEGAITSLFANSNKESKVKFELDETDNFGSIEFKFNGLDSTQQYIVELIDDKKEKVFYKKVILNQHTLLLKDFPGGKYNLRIIKDLNKNKRWDPANVYTKTQAEPIWYLDKSFTIRSNWEQSETIEPTFN